MIDKNSNITVLHDDNGVFTDYSHKMATFGRDAITLTVTNAEDYIYVGYSKPINAFYVDITTANGSESTLSLEYWNGSTWTTVDNTSDDTFGMFRSGFVRWDRESTNQVANAVNGNTKYWYRMLPAVDRTGIVLSGLGLVFSDDYELSLEQPYISDPEFLGSASSHIKTHMAVRNEIIQKFRNKNYIKTNSVTGVNEDINVWDLLDIDEVKLAACYLALSKVYMQLSDNPEDVWGAKAGVYEDKFNKYINIARLSIDVDDNGLVSAAENKPGFKQRFFSR